MQKEVICVAVGQCGNQLSRAFWDQKLLEENFRSNSTLFHNEWSGCKARGLLIDTEPRVINGTLRSRQGYLFDEEVQVLKRSSGAGNNFAHGYFGYGDYHCSTFEEMFRRQVEKCGCLETVLFMHSLGGGTGSGFGTRILAEVADILPKVNRAVTSVLPSKEASDVVTSPYNMLLALKKISDCASVSFPVDNNKLAELGRLSGFGRPSRCDKVNETAECGFYSMNVTIAKVLSDLTNFTGFQEDRRTYLFDIKGRLSNPKKHFLTTSTSLSDGNKATKFSQYAARSSQESEISRSLFTSLVSRSNSLICHENDLKMYAVSESTFICRGKEDKFRLSFEGEVERWKSAMKSFPKEKEKISLGFVTSKQETEPALTCISNSAAIAETFRCVYNNAKRFYRKKAMLHHYTQYCDPEHFDEAFESLKINIDSYQLPESGTTKKRNAPVRRVPIKSRPPPLQPTSNAGSRKSVSRRAQPRSTR